MTEIAPNVHITMTDARRAAMRLCAHACCAELDQALERLAPVPAHDVLRTPQTGLVMLQGRIGGDGGPFNLGEASASRATIRLAGGEIGFAYHLGRDLAKATAAAVLDALWQDDSRRQAVEAALRPVAERLAAEADRTARRTAATRVNFFTMVRGDD
ncbi:alpha-D-ribose 1-methylphosphonate 5-triphosphate synthase subunit PhnG [Labrys monachus]|uniref:Alpha-D-ribose 1-methylphosphonate 5-triphosphate synthase subunit PhnG n=2 Tax=Labrys monachus TaxID=217067 RepID=A0ABU0FJ88_9HYPH|nr:alpha-D-ribose 1-methylphosphonate 5-triphosphate synthase subunit PhnG [Labrys monachus]